jgi:hypothetical protein
MPQVVGEQQELKAGDPIVGRDLAPGIVVEPFANILREGGRLSLEPPPSPGMGFQIGDPNLVGMLAVLEHSQLLDRVFGNRASHHHQAVAATPVERLRGEVPDLPPRA